MRLEVMVKMFGKDYSDATSLVLYYIDDEYRKTRADLLTTIGNKPNIWLKAVTIARENGLLYYFAKNVLEIGGGLPSSYLKGIVEQEKKGFEKLKNTVTFINRFFQDEGLDFMFIKLYRSVPYVPRDVDILVKKEQNQQLVAALRKRNIALKEFYGVEVNIEKEGLLKVDLYQGFYYLSLHFMDDNFLWKNPRAVDICGIKCSIPSVNADFLSLLLHAILGHRYLSLLDFLYVKSLLRKGVNIDETFYQAQKFKWAHGFQTIVSTIQNIQNIYYGLYLKSNKTVSTNFPYAFSTKFIWEAFQGFPHMKMSSKTKFVFILSTLIENAFQKYRLIQRSVPVEMSNEIKDIIMRGIHKVRSLSGDYKWSYSVTGK